MLMFGFQVPKITPLQEGLQQFVVRLDHVLAHMWKLLQKLLQGVAIWLDIKVRLADIHIASTKFRRCTNDNNGRVDQRDKYLPHIHIGVAREPLINVRHEELEMRPSCIRVS